MRNVSIQLKPSTRSFGLGTFLGVMIGIVAFAPIWMRNGGPKKIYSRIGDNDAKYL